MPRLTPYLQRRGDALFFRIAVPLDLRPNVGAREINKTLRTIDRRIAIPRALHLASRALQLFAELRAMPKEKRGRLRIDFGMDYSFDELGRPKLQFTDIKPGEEQAVMAITRQLQLTSQASTPAIVGQQHQAIFRLSEVITAFISSPEVASRAEMVKKHRLVLPILVEVIGDKMIDQLRQSDILDVFNVIRKLPKHWTYERKKGRTIRDIASNSADRELMAEWTFAGSYRASIRTFLGWAVTNYQDQGFPTTLTVEKIAYAGKRKKGTQQTQRAFTVGELKRLFEGPEMQAYAADPAQAHQFWLAHIGLFTGARVNEICQMNPQVDVLQDAESGIWYFLISDGTDADDEVTKSVKTGINRQVPIHRTLLDLGILAYIERVKATGSKLLFPEWKPKGGRAAPNAGEAFIEFLKVIGIHGVENERGHAIRGSHAFRHSLLTYSKEDGQKSRLRCITGHKERSDNEVADGYEDDTITLPLAEKKRLLDRLDYGLVFHTPLGATPDRTAAT